MQAFYLPLEILEIPAILENIICLLNASFTANLGLDNRFNLIGLDLISADDTIDLKANRHIYHENTINQIPITRLKKQGHFQNHVRVCLQISTAEQLSLNVWMQ
jgi:hypothetical protein